MSTHCYQVIYPIKEWDFIYKRLTPYLKRDEERIQGSEESFELIRLYKPEIYSEEFEKEERQKTAEQYPKVYMLKGENVCSIARSNNRWQNNVFNTGRISAEDNSPVIITKFETFSPEHFFLSLEFGMNGEILSFSQKIKVPEEKVYSDAGYLYDMKLTKSDKKTMKEKMTNNIPVFFGVAEAEDADAVYDFELKWQKIWHDKSLDGYQTAEKICELLHFPVFFPMVDEPKLKCIREGTVLNVFTYNCGEK